MSSLLRRESGAVLSNGLLWQCTLGFALVHQSNTSDNLWSLPSKPADNPLSESMDRSDAITKIFSVGNSESEGLVHWEEGKKAA